MLRKYSVTMPNGQKVDYDTDYTGACRHAQMLCAGTKHKPQITARTWADGKWIEEKIEINN